MKEKMLKGKTEKKNNTTVIKLKLFSPFFPAGSLSLPCPATSTSPSYPILSYSAAMDGITSASTMRKMNIFLCDGDGRDKFEAWGIKR